MVNKTVFYSLFYHFIYQIYCFKGRYPYRSYQGLINELSITVPNDKEWTFLNICRSLLGQSAETRAPKAKNKSAKITPPRSRECPPHYPPPFLVQW